MTIFAMGFVFISLFTALLGFGMVLFLSFDVDRTEIHGDPTDTQTMHAIIRRLNTNTIETIDADGIQQRWTRSD